jgi:threonine aldolase
MLDAMLRAEVGDDVAGDDPTVIALEETAARLTGKEAGLFVPSGTMGNNIAIKAHTRPGDEVLMDWDSHSMCYEVGAPAVLSGVQTRQYRSVRGIPDLEVIQAAIHKPDLHAPGTSLVVVENTHNKHGGAVIPADVLEEVGALARETGIAFHMDGARLFNAAVASGQSAAEIAGPADSVTFCLSKGLGCPVGSVLCGGEEFIARARRIRKMFGGGLRQAGFLAAAGLYALEYNVDRLAEDHANARRLAEGIHGLPGLSVDPERIQTNMVYFDTEGLAAPFVEQLRVRGVLCFDTGPCTIRMVTHLDVSAEQIEEAVGVLRHVAETSAT